MVFFPLFTARTKSHDPSKCTHPVSPVVLLRLCGSRRLKAVRNDLKEKQASRNDAIEMPDSRALTPTKQAISAPEFEDIDEAPRSRAVGEIGESETSKSQSQNNDASESIDASMTDGGTPASDSTATAAAASTVDLMTAPVVAYRTSTQEKSELDADVDYVVDKKVAERMSKLR
jgi:hypothetical protein